MTIGYLWVQSYQVPPTETLAEFANPADTTDLANSAPDLDGTSKTKPPAETNSANANLAETPKSKETKPAKTKPAKTRSAKIKPADVKPANESKPEALTKKRLGNEAHSESRIERRLFS